MENIKKIFSEALMIDLGEVENEMKFREHSSWDSLAALTIIASISDEFGVDVSDKDLKSVETVAQLNDLIEGKKK